MIKTSVAKCVVSFLHKLNNACDHSNVTAKLLMPARRVWKKLGMGQALYRIAYDQNSEYQEQLRKEQESFQCFFTLHEQDFSKLSEMLEDDFSRTTLEKVLECRRTGNMELVKDVYVEPQYFQKDIFGPVEDEVFVDGGAYVGDTVESFLQNFAGGYKKIYAWEPDEANMATMKKSLKKLDDIVFVPCGMWDKETELSFSDDGTMSSQIIEGATANGVKIKVNSIDNVCSSDKVTLIKMDIEGSEQAALQGAVNVIKRDKPRLAICIYHKPEDLYEIPFWIKQIVPEYKLYIRHHTLGINDTVVYATL